MANLRDLVGEYVVRTKPVIYRTGSTILFGESGERTDRSYMDVYKDGPIMCKEIVDDTPIICGKNTVPFILSSTYDDDNWKSITKALKRCEELLLEEENKNEQ